MNKTNLIKENSSVEKDLDVVVVHMDKFLDALYRLSIHGLTRDQFFYLESQLRKVPGHVTVYLLRLARYIKKGQDARKA